MLLLHAFFQVWSKLGIKREDLDLWRENCRKWLAETVVGPVAKEIESINDTLCKIGSSDFQIGSMSLGMLRQVAKSKLQYVPTLGMVIPYLELSSKQEYLVQRIKELAKGGYISAYRWNAGGTWKGRSWDQDLPTDSQIVMHLLCTYLDSHIPPNPRFPGGRSFSDQYFLKAPDKPAAKKSDFCIYQASVNPPQYKVLLKEMCIEIPKGRNNLFHSLVAFLHHIKTHENSMLGQVNLELSGMNILWIVGGK